MNKKEEESLKETMGFKTLIVSVIECCEKCIYWKEVKEKNGWTSICTYNNIGYIEVCSMGRCDNFVRTQE